MTCRSVQSLQGVTPGHQNLGNLQYIQNVHFVLSTMFSGLNYSRILPLHFLCICLFGVLRRFQHCTGHITTGSWKGRGNQYIEFARVVYCKLPTNGKQLPAFPLEPMRGLNPGLRGGRRECYHSATVAPCTFFVITQILLGCFSYILVGFN